VVLRLRSAPTHAHSTSGPVSPARLVAASSRAGPRARQLNSPVYWLNLWTVGMAREQFPVDRRQIRVTWPLLLIVVGALACLLDAFTTWDALHRQSHFIEQSPTTANLIAALGLTGGLAISVLLRVAIFSGVAVAMERLPRLSKPLFAIGLLAVAATWLIVLGNISTLAAL
jgi:hypothetical protein